MKYLKSQSQYDTNNINEENQVTTLIKKIREWTGEDKNLEEIKQLLNNTNINSTTDKGINLFSIAATTGHLDILEIMIKHKPNKETVGKTLNNLAFLMYEFASYKKPILPLLLILKSKLDYTFLKDSLEHYFPFYLRYDDFLTFKKINNTKYEEYLMLEKSNDYNI